MLPRHKPMESSRAPTVIPNRVQWRLLPTLLATFALLAALGASWAQAAITTVTITGVVGPAGIEDHDYHVFTNCAPAECIAGLPFTLTYRIDDSLGVQNNIPNVQSVIEDPPLGVPQVSPISATLAINGITVSYSCAANQTFLQLSNATVFYSGGQTTVSYYKVCGSSAGGIAASCGFTFGTTGAPAIPIDFHSPLDYTFQPSDKILVCGYNYVPSPDAGGAVSYAALVPQHISISGPQAPPTSANICFNGQNVTGSSVTVLVGQPISLLATSDSSCVDLAQSASPLWTLTGNVIADWTLTATSAQVTYLTAADYADPALTPFYWITPGVQTVTYADGTHPPVSATFNVMGPTGAIVLPKTGQVQVSNNNSLDDGESAGTPGILFYAAAAFPSGVPAGHFLWAQLLNTAQVVVTGPLGTYQITDNYVCSPGITLDNTFPYSKPTDPYVAIPGDMTDDSPHSSLIFVDSEISKTFAARMYLLWTSNNPNTENTSGAIPVPLGFVDWGFTADATQTNFVWSVKTASVTTPVFQASSQYPQWSTVFINNQKPLTCQ